MHQKTSNLGTIEGWLPCHFFSMQNGALGRFWICTNEKLALEKKILPLVEARLILEDCKPYRKPYVSQFELELRGQQDW